MIQKLTPEEIKSRQDAATGYWQSVKALELELEAAKRNVKVLKAQIAEANRNFDTLMGEISSGEVEVDGQGRRSSYRPDLQNVGSSAATV